MRLLACALALVALLGGCVPRGQPAASQLLGDARQSLEALAALRGADGHWPAGLEPYVVEAAVAARVDVTQWPTGDPLARHVAFPPANASFLASLRPLYALALADLPRDDPARAAHITTRIMQGFDGQQFGDPRLLNDDAFALLVLAAAGADFHDPAYAHAGEALLANQTGGGWSWSVGGAPETDMTGIVLSALSQVPGAMARIDAASAQTFLAATRTPDAGHSLMADGSAHGNCDSTVWAIRADAALGLSADPHAWAFLATLRHTDGSYSYVDGGPANALCTAEAATLIALAAQGSVAPPPVPMPSSF